MKRLPISSEIVILRQSTNKIVSMNSCVEAMEDFLVFYFLRTSFSDLVSSHANKVFLRIIYFFWLPYRHLAKKCSNTFGMPGPFRNKTTSNLAKFSGFA